MDIRSISPELSVSPQVSVADIGTAAAQGFRSIVCNRPDGEGDDQTPSAEIAAAAAAQGIAFRYLPVVSGKLDDADIAAFEQALAELPGPVLAYCRSGTRSITLWALTKAPRLSVDAILRAAAGAGYDLAGLRPKLEARAEGRAGATGSPTAPVHEVVIVGGGAGGLAAAASLLRRRPGLDIVVVEPKDMHYYQPGWTLVGGGVFERAHTVRPMAAAMPKGVKWVRAAVSGFEPDKSRIVLEDGERIGYRALVVAPGLALDWERIEGLEETLGRNGVTSNYRFDLAPYTWELVRGLRHGRAIFTQPPMPIKCAGAPQKAMYMAADHWRRSDVLGDIDVAFHSAGAVLFGVSEFVPALMHYVEAYRAELHFSSNLVAIDGPARRAWFEVRTPEGEVRREEAAFDMIHVCPPQKPLGFLRDSPLGDAAGWVEVDPQTLRHVRHGNIFGLGDGCSAPNAKTAAAVRKQAPVVAENLLALLDGLPACAIYDGYGSCPLTVERGKVVLAEFGYGGVLQPTFPRWLIDGTRPSRLAWLLKEKLMPAIYWDLMLKGREWLAKPARLRHAPAAHEAAEACAMEPPAGGPA